MAQHGGTIGASSGTSEEQKVDPASISARFDALNQARYEVIERGRDGASVTIPSVSPPESTDENIKLPTPYQGIGARAVNNLANKLLLTLFPVSSPFFKLEISESVLQQEQDNGNTDLKVQVEKELSKLESIIQSDMEVSAFRTKFFEAIRAMLITGNFLLHIPKEGAPVGYSLEKYVVKRSVRGEVLEIILREYISRSEMKKEWLDQLEAADALQERTNDQGNTIPADKFTLYTRIHLDGKLYKEIKSINNIELKGTDGSYPRDSNAWLALRWNGLSGEDYGRGYVEEYLGDFRAIEGLRKALLEHSAISSKTFGIIRPGSMITPRDLVRVKNGGFVVGDPEDLIFPEIGKYNDMQVASAQVSEITESVSRAFLLTQTRDAERVTAEEIRLQANELETALGGAYSLLADTFQKPILMREISRLKKGKLIPTIDDKALEPKVIVGLEGLGRGAGLEKFMAASAALVQIAPALELMPDIDREKMVQFIYNSVGMDADDVMMSPEKKQQKAAAEQQAQMQQAQLETAQDVAGKVAAPVAKGAIENPENTANAIQGAQQMMQQQ